MPDKMFAITQIGTNRLSSYILFPVTAVLLFACGLAVGQSTPRWHKYLVRSEATELERQFQIIELDRLRSELSIFEELENTGRDGVPSFSVDPKTGKIQALVSVPGKYVDTVPLEEAQQSLKSDAQDILFHLKFQMPEISDSDVVIYFAKINHSTNEIINNFAEYKDGQLTIRQVRR